MKLTRSQWEKMGWETDYKKSIEFKTLTDDSRECRKNAAFIAFDSETSPAVRYVFQALEKKAIAVFIDSRYRNEIESSEAYTEQLFFYSKNFYKSASDLVSLYFDHPEEKISLVAITGTNGKTTIALAMHQALNYMKLKSAYVGTLGAQFAGETMTKLQNTTPPYFKNFQLISQAVKKKNRFAIFEASSHGIVQNRIYRLPWKVAIFTNLTPDHLDYHVTLENYYQAKKKLFEIFINNKDNDERFAIINTYNDFGQRLATELHNDGVQIESVNVDGDFSINEIEATWEGYRASITYREETVLMKTRFIGLHNIFNMVSVYAALLKFESNRNKVLEAIAAVKPPAGRLEIINAPGGRKIVIDYAHSPDSLEMALKTIQELNPIRTITIFGCGGDRDNSKRPLMGRVATLYSDFVIITNDNPRSEDPQSIANDIKAGTENSNYIVVFERDRAIRVGLQILGMQEVLLIAGKGHEETQEIEGKLIKFNDKKNVKKALKEQEY